MINYFFLKKYALGLSTKSLAMMDQCLTYAEFSLPELSGKLILNHLKRAELFGPLTSVLWGFRAVLE